MSVPIQQEIPTSDGDQLVARFFEPAQSAKGAVLIPPAMGVPQHYYAAFATWLAAQGWLTATFDFRGIGLSRRGHLREVNVTARDWAQIDCAAAVDALLARAGDKPFYWIGHSFAGQVIPLVPNRHRITKIITIAAGTAYWHEYTPLMRFGAWLMFYIAAPLTMPLAGYFPGKRLGMVGDLPRGVMTQWRRWCLHPDYLIGVEGADVRSQYESVKTPIFSLSFTDDEFMSARGIEAMHRFYRSAPLKVRRLAPSDIGVRRIGHFGFFRREFENLLWRPHLLPELA